MTPAPPSWMEALFVNIGAALLSAGVGFIRLSAVVPGILLGVLVYLGAGRGGFAVLVAFFLLGSLTTRLGYRAKSSMGLAEKKGGARGGAHAVANAGVAAIIATVSLLRMGEGDWLRAGYTASLATAALDTAGTELGQLFGKRPFLIPSFRAVPVGTPGAVSLPGLVGGVLSAILVAGVGIATRYLPAGLLPHVVLGALAGGIAESLIRARGSWNHQVLNFLNTAVGAGVAAGLVALGVALAV